MINPFTVNNPRYCKLCMDYILTRSAPPVDRDEVNMDLIHAYMKTDIFPLISTIILPRVLTPCYPVRLEIFSVIC